MRKPILVYPVGTEVTITQGNIKATISGICVYQDRVEYQLSYFHSGVHYQPWSADYNFKTKAHKTQRIGFK